MSLRRTLSVGPETWRSRPPRIVRRSSSRPPDTLLRQLVHGVPGLCERISAQMRELLAERGEICRATALRQVSSELDYVWLESDEFRSALSACAEVKLDGCEDRCDIDTADALRAMMTAYYSDVRASLARTLPRCIMSELVRPVQKQTRSRLFGAVSGVDPSDILQESKDAQRERDRLTAALEAVASARHELARVT